MDLVAFAAPRPKEISIAKRPDFNDDPSKLRWRAWWQWTYDGQIEGVDLVCYPVLKATPAGAWIDPTAYHFGEWSIHESLKRWVSNDGGAAWAKPTQQQALDSLLVRHNRWASRLYSDVTKFRSTLAAIEALFPDRQENAKALLAMIAEGARQ